MAFFETVQSGGGSSKVEFVSYGKIAAAISGSLPGTKTLNNMTEENYIIVFSQAYTDEINARISAHEINGDTDKVISDNYAENVRVTRNGSTITMSHTKSNTMNYMIFTY